MQCWCKTYRCQGALRSARTRYNHYQKESREYQEASAHITSSVGDFDKYLDLSMYSKMPEASMSMYPGSRLTILEAVFEIFRDFVFSAETQASVSKRLKLLKEKFLPDNNAMPASLDEALKML